MKKKNLIIILVATTLLQAYSQGADKWEIVEAINYNIYFQKTDSSNIQEYMKMLNEGILRTEEFFGSKFKQNFDVYIHPDRASLDRQWQQDFGMPDFKSECWMVASGIADKLDMISPKRWDSLSCEHKYSNTQAVKNLITHELIHVFHGQVNPSPDFSNVEGIDWFVEGLATYASGQCDLKRLTEVKEAIGSGNIPGSLSQFWTGKLRYGLSGSVVMYIYSKYGRQKLMKLMSTTNTKDLFSTLGDNEEKVLKGWKEFMKKLNI